MQEFPVSKTITGVILDLDPGALREPHWHPHANEWQSTSQRQGADGPVRLSTAGIAAEEFATGDAGYIPQGFGHYVENTGDTPSRVLIAFDSGEYQEIGLSTWLASNPNGSSPTTSRSSDALVEKMPDHRVFVARKKGDRGNNVVECHS